MHAIEVTETAGQASYATSTSRNLNPATASS